jgi:D-alanine-D-alanine ligase
MDKEVLKRLLAESGIPIVEFETFHRGDRPIEELCARFAFPMFVKPANLGSSVGISKVQCRDGLEAAIDVAAQFDTKILVERGIVGREFECSVLGNQEPIAAGPCEIIPSREFYDYEDKYILDAARTLLPAPVSEEVAAEIRRLAVESYRAAGCEGMARVDFLMEGESGKLYVGEINTVPGFTSISMYPKMWEAAGVSFSALVDRLIELALERHRARQATRFCR